MTNNEKLLVQSFLTEKQSENNKIRTMTSLSNGSAKDEYLSVGLITGSEVITRLDRIDIIIYTNFICLTSELLLRHNKYP